MICLHDCNIFLAAVNHRPTDALPSGAEAMKPTAPISSILGSQNGVDFGYWAEASELQIGL